MLKIVFLYTAVYFKLMLYSNSAYFYLSLSMLRPMGMELLWSGCTVSTDNQFSKFHHILSSQRHEWYIAFLFPNYSLPWLTLHCSVVNEMYEIKYSIMLILEFWIV
jgi:hypothetical protein